MFSHEVLDLDLMLKKGLLPDDKRFYEKAGDLILEKKPDIIFFTVHGLNHLVVLKLSKRIKKQRPCFIVVGGVGPTLKAKEALARCPEIDVIVRGEGEPVVKHLIPAVFENGDFTKVPSIVYRQNGRVIENPRAYLGANEPIPSPDYSLVQISDYIAHNKKHPYVHPGFVLIESGRGCPYRCSFCAPAKMWEGRVRYRPVEEIVAEMTFLAGKGGDFSFFTQDNLEKDFLFKLSNALIRGKKNISWGCYSRLDRLPDNMAPLLSKAGCRLIFTGFETPNRNAQKKIRKVVNSAATFEKLKIFNHNGIRFIGSFIAGFSGETEDELDATMRFAIECAVGHDFETLNRVLDQTVQHMLPQAPENICIIHPLFYMPGTDDFNEGQDALHISKYSLHPDCYGSYLFSHDEFRDDWSFLGSNPYINHMPEEQVRYYCSILRLFNFLNSRPYFFALLIRNRKKTPLEMLKEMAACLGEEFVLAEKIETFEAKSRAYVKQYLAFVPPWTAKKGQ